RVLVAVDGSDTAVATVMHAQRLLPDRRQLTVCSVVHAPVPMLSPIANAAVGAAYASVQLEEEVHGQMLTAAESVVARIPASFENEEPSQLVVSGDPATEICRIAADEKFDLIVVG